MKTNARRKKYVAISSLAELHKQKKLLDISIKKQEIVLLDDVGEIREYMSFPNLKDFAFDALSQKFPIIRNAKIGFRVISSLLSGRRSREGGCGCGCDGE